MAVVAGPAVTAALGLTLRHLQARVTEPLLTQLRGLAVHLAIVDPARGTLDHTLQGVSYPVMAVVRGGSLQGTMAALHQGFDDCVCLPFEPAVVVERLLAGLRRSAGVVPVLDPVITAGRFQHDAARNQIAIDGRDLDLTPVERRLLFALTANAGRVLDRETLMDLAWGNEHALGSNVVDSHLRKLRAKLDELPNRFEVDTVRGRGYGISLRMLGTADAG